MAGEYEVKEMLASPEAWITGRTLGELRLRDEGVLVRGVVRPDGSCLGVPHKHTRIVAGDTLILYGRDGKFVELTERLAGAEGDRAHAAAVAVEPEDARTG